MNEEPFRHRHPFLYHLKEHSRELAGAALALLAIAWFCAACWMASVKILKSFPT